MSRRQMPWRKVTAMTATHSGVRSTRWRWIAAMWCAGALFDASQSVFILHAEGKNHGELRSSRPSLPRGCRGCWQRRSSSTWRGDIRSFAADGTRRSQCTSPPSRHQRGRGGLVCVAPGALQPVGSSATAHLLGHLEHDTVFQALTFLIAYVLILTITYLVESRDNVARQMTETARLNEELSNAQLAALRRQMEPHFMFNTLNSIAGLVRDHRNDAAVNMIVGLSEFLRRASEDSHRSQVTLAEEVEYLQRYIDIQKFRFGERLRVSVDIPADLLDAQVPEPAAAASRGKLHQAWPRQARGRRAIRVAGSAQGRQPPPERLQRWPGLPE